LTSAQLVGRPYDEVYVRSRKPPSAEDSRPECPIPVFNVTPSFIDDTLAQITGTNEVNLSFVENFETKDLQTPETKIDIIVNKSKLDPKWQEKIVYDGTPRSLDQSNKAPKFKLYTFIKRYCDRKNIYVHKRSELSKYLLNAFVDAYIDPVRMKYIGDVKTYELVALHEYLESLSEAKIGQMTYEDHKSLLRQKFQAYCKNRVASKYEKLAYIATKAGQGIIYAGKSMNTKFSPQMRAVMMKLQFVLKDGMYIDVGFNEEQLRYLMLRHNYKNQKYLQIENDFGSFDCTQGKELRDFEIDFYKYMGLDESEAGLYDIINATWSCRTNDGMLKFSQAYMRKSGEPATLLGNTICNMAMCALLIDFTRSEHRICIFKGDDSSMIFANAVFHCSEKVLEIKYGMQMKYFVGNPHYFSSRFFLEDCTPMPDPLKFVVKLTGRKYEERLYEDQIAEHYEAYVDRLSLIRNEQELKYLAASAAIYYKLSYMVALKLCYIMYWTRSIDNLKSLYNTKKMTIC
jgi:hypothetical protein